MHQRKTKQTEIVLASRNKDKAREIKKLLKGLPVKILTLKDFSKVPRVREDGKSFDENAIKKALTISRFTGRLTVADDSGLEVKALGGKPGVRSARFAGKGCTYADNNRKLLKLMKDVPRVERKAEFKCSVAICDKLGLVSVVRGSCKGWISLESRGKTGFGYDPVFIVPKYKKTFAKLGSTIKNRISHRAKAFKKAKSVIQRYLRRASASCQRAFPR